MTPIGYNRLILTRHAKSSWDDPAIDDHDRPLNDRGRRTARELGDWLASRGYEPEEILCSTARRTQETWQVIAGAPLETRPAVRMESALYNATPAKMMDMLKTATHQTVMMVGHNPGIAEFAALLPQQQPIDPDFRRYPTAATLVVDFQITDWADLRPGTGSVMEFIRLQGRD